MARTSAFRGQIATGASPNESDATATSVSGSQPGRRVAGIAVAFMSGYPTSPLYPSTGWIAPSIPITSVVMA